MQASGQRGRRFSRIWLVGGALVVASLAICCGACAGQAGAPQGIPAAPAGEGLWVTEEQAMVTTERFARAADLPWMDDGAHATFDADGEHSPARWKITVTSDGFQAALYTVDAVGNYVSSAWNRLDLDSGARTQEVELSPEEALARAERIIEATGIARRLVALSKLELVWDPGARAQHWRVEWERVLDGQRVGLFATVVLNAESGAVVQATRTGWQLTPMGIQVDRKAARRRALEIGAEVLGSAKVELDRLPDLRPVLPNDYFAPGGSGTSSTSPLRMAWVAVVSTQRGAKRTTHLWIDAVDGRLLGGGVYGMEDVPGGERPVGRSAVEGSAGQGQRVASGYLAAAIAGIAGVIIIVVLLVLWPRRGGGSGTSGNG